MPRRINLGRLGRRTKPAHVVLSSVLVAMLVAPYAVAQSGSTSTPRVERSDARYAFLARNTLQGDGGAGAFACRSDANPAGQTNREPCLNMVNTGTGYAAAFRTRGLTGFRLQTSGAGEATPFLLDSNATGKVEHLNADRVDGLSADQIRSRFGRVTFTAPSTVAVANGANGVTAVARTSAGRYQVTFDRNVSQCGLQVTSSDVSANRTAAVEPLASNTAIADVAIRDATAVADAPPVDGSFYIAANC
jgi:hypothetical protein